MSSNNTDESLSTIMEIDDDKIREMCDMVSRQTDYTLDEIKDKLIEYNYQYTDIIREYMGIKKDKQYVIKSLNQEIYKQIRRKMDNIMKDYNERSVKNAENTENTENNENNENNEKTKT